MIDTPARPRARNRDRPTVGPTHQLTGWPIDQLIVSDQPTDRPSLSADVALNTKKAKEVLMTRRFILADEAPLAGRPQSGTALHRSIDVHALHETVASFGRFLRTLRKM